METSQAGAIVTSKVRMSENIQLAEELHKPVIEESKRRKLYVRSKDKIWGNRFS